MVHALTVSCTSEGPRRETRIGFPLFDFVGAQFCILRYSGMIHGSALATNLLGTGLEKCADETKF